MADTCFFKYATFDDDWNFTKYIKKKNKKDK